MSTTKSIFLAGGITAVSLAFITIVKGVQTESQLLGVGLTVFVLAFVVARFRW